MRTLITPTASAATPMTPTDQGLVSSCTDRSANGSTQTDDTR